MDINYNQHKIKDLYYQLSLIQKRIKDYEILIESNKKQYDTFIEILNSNLNRTVRNPSKKYDLSLEMDELYEELGLPKIIKDIEHYKSELNKKNIDASIIKNEIKILEIKQKTGSLRPPLYFDTQLTLPGQQSTLLTLPPQTSSPRQSLTNNPQEGAFIYEEEDDEPVLGSGSSLEIEKLKEYALSDGDIEDLLGKDIFICVYPYLNEVEHIDQIFDDKGRCMLLFNTINDSAGHWVCMHKKKDRIDFFDPYGLKPDEPMKWLTEQKRDDLDMETRRLTQLLKSSGYKVYYNTFEFQSDKQSNTCGRWCATRLLKLNLNLDQFYKFINDYKNKYELGTLENAVTYLTYEIINK